MDANLPISTVGYFIRHRDDIDEIFLGIKAATPKAIKRKIAGKLLGYGGDLEPTDKSIKHCFKRELGEESNFSIDLDYIEVVGKITIIDENGPRLTLYYLFLRKWTGNPKVNNEILDPRWYPSNPLPENILDSARLILPLAFKGKKITGWVKYDNDMNATAHELVEVDSIE